MLIGTTIKSIQDVMRKDVGVDGDAQRIGQLAWMLFLKILDDREQEYELLDPDCRSPVPASLRRSRRSLSSVASSPGSTNSWPSATTWRRSTGRRRQPGSSCWRLWCGTLRKGAGEPA
jgi:hypothetical protein